MGRPAAMLETMTTHAEWRPLDHAKLEVVRDDP
jgi:hypothetical protein